MQDDIKHALDRGWAVFPCQGKRPLTPHGYRDAVSDPDGWSLFDTVYPTANAYGVATGASGLVVLDVDMGEGKRGAASYAALEANHVIPETFTVATGGGGLHLYFKAPETPVRSSAGKIGVDLDIRAQGGYVIGAGSAHASGNPYTVLVDAQAAPMPAWLVDLCSRASAPSLHAGGVAPGLSRDRPSEAEIRKVLPRWKKLGRSYQSANVAWVTLRAVLDSRAYADPGVIYDTTKDLAYWLSKDLPKLDAGWFADTILEVCWVQMKWPGGAQYDPGKIRGDWLRAWETGLEKHEADRLQRLQRQQDTRDSLVSRAFSGRRSHAYTEEEVQGFAESQDPPLTAEEWAKRWLIQNRDRFYVWLLDGYQGPFIRAELLSACEMYLPPAGDWVRLETVGPQGDIVRRPVDQVLRDYSTLATQVVYDMTANTTQYDAALGKLSEASCPLQDIEPRCYPEVQTWLEQLTGGGTALARLMDWMATVTDLGQSAPALWLLGGAGTGKTLIARGLARLWSREGRPADLEDAMGRFNADILRCPLVLADEKIPADGRGKPRMEDMKAFITQETHRIEKKGVELSLAEGAARLVIATNNESLLDMRADLTEDDIKALGQRVILIEIPGGCPTLDPATARRWLETGAIASHAMHLARTRVVRGARLACESTPQLVERHILAQSGMLDMILQHVVEQILRPGGTSCAGPVLAGNRPEPAVRVFPDGRVGLNGTRLVDELDANVGSRSIKRMLKNVTTQVEKRPRPLNEGEGRGVRYRLLNESRLVDWLEVSCHDYTEVMEALEKRVEDAKELARDTEPGNLN